MARKSRKQPLNQEFIFNATDKYVTDRKFNTALYLRISVENNSKNDTIENQQKILEEYVNSNIDFNVVSIYKDVGITGTNFNRPEFIRMMADVENGLIDCIIVKDLSRLGRNSIDTGYYIEKFFPTFGVRFIAVNDNYDSYSKSQDTMIITIKNIINEAYANDISQKIKASMKTKQINGEHLGTFAPYGYKRLTTEKKAPVDALPSGNFQVTGSQSPALRVDNSYGIKNQLIIDHETAPIVQMIFNDISNGMSDTAIAKKLNKQGIISPTEYLYKAGILKHPRFQQMKFWHKTAVKRIAENEVYIGNLVQGKKVTENKITTRITDESKWVVALNTHEAIIDINLFDTVKKIRVERREKYYNNIGKNEHMPRIPNILQGKIQCGDCKRPLTRKRCVKNDKVFYIYTCPTYEVTSSDDCTRKYIKENELINIVFSAIKNRIDICLEFDRSLSTIKKSNIEKDYNNNLNLKKQELKRIERLKMSLYQNYVTKIISKEDYLKLNESYSDDTQKLEIDISNIEDTFKKQLKKNLSIKSFKNFKNDTQFTKEMADALIHTIKVFKDNVIEINFKFNDEFEMMVKSTKGGV